MQTIEQLKAKQEKEMIELVEKHEIVSYFADIHNKKPAITFCDESYFGYRAAISFLSYYPESDFTAVIAHIEKEWNILPMSRVKYGIWADTTYPSATPPETRERDELKKSVPIYPAIFDLHSGVGFDSRQLEFCAEKDGKVYRFHFDTKEINVRIKGRTVIRDNEKVYLYEGVDYSPLTKLGLTVHTSRSSGCMVNVYIEPNELPITELYKRLKA